jgi:hypothetical protein
MVYMAFCFILARVLGAGAYKMHTVSTSLENTVMVDVSRAVWEWGW